MYANKHFTKEEMMKYKIVPTNKKDDWEKTITYFITLYVMQKAYSEYCATETGFGSASNNIHITPEMRVGHTYKNINIGGTIGASEDEETTAHHDYIDVLEESLSDAK